MNTRCRAAALAVLQIGLLAAAVAPQPARGQAEAYPTKPIRMVVPFPPGGSVDLNGRLLSVKLSELLGQQVIVDNRGGASGMIGSEQVMRAAPDGYTLLMNSVPFVTSTVLYSRAPYDPVSDFAPISLVSSVPTTVAVHPSLPVKSVRELIAFAKARPGGLNYASSGIGSNSNITGELFNLMGKVNIVAIQFKGGGPALLAAVSGETHVSFSNISETARMAEAKRLRVLGVSSPRRSPILPDVPTIAEAGLPGFEFAAWHGVLAPKGTPPKLVAFLNEKIRSAMGAPDQVKRFQERGMEVVTDTPEEFTAYLKSEVEKWGRVVRERNMKAE